MTPRCPLPLLLSHGWDVLTMDQTFGQPSDKRWVHLRQVKVEHRGTISSVTRWGFCFGVSFLFGLKQRESFSTGNRRNLLRKAMVHDERWGRFGNLTASLL
uniref:Uncharacterized protein n=1 Tax=Bionectria ochroleuca TaxID=29856 RepID=A0A8H7NCH7_BIOOC